jgi:hypothetical protein
MWKELCRREPEYAKYSWPPRGAEAEKKSFKLQCDKHITEFETPSPRQLEESNARLLPQYIQHKFPNFLLHYDRKEWSESIDVLKAELKPEASPGVPHAKVAKRNDCFVSAMGERFNDIVLDRIERILATSLSTLKTMTRKERMDENLMDPVRVFVKNEPHSIEKISTGRVRLIMSVSLTDKMIEMLLCRHLTKLEVQNWRLIPSKPGIGFTEENSACVYNDVMFSGLPMSYADISGWDWGVKQWQVLDAAIATILLASQKSPVFEHLMVAKAYLETESIYQFSDGVLVQPLFKGIVNSGKFRTSRDNSFMRVRIADLIGSRKTIAAGDDSVENTVEDAAAKYLKYGIRCKEYLPVQNSFEFCSHYYGPQGSYALNKEKMVMNLLHQSPKDFLEYRMSMVGFEAELETRPDYQKILELVESVGYFEVEGPHYTL